MPDKSKEINWTVNVEPIAVPIITPMTCGSCITLAVPRPTIIDVTAPELCRIVVRPTPTPIDKNLDFESLFISVVIREAINFSSALEAMVLPYKKKETPANKIMM